MRINKWLISLLILVPAMETFSQQNRADSSQVLEDVVVEESYEAEFQEDKLPAAINIDFAGIIQIPELIHWAGIDGKDNNPDSQELRFPALAISSPELTNIRPEPLKVFKTKFDDLEYWQLEIHNSDGSLFKRFSGEKSPPEVISWDGRGDREEHLTPGRNYSYDFTAINKAGNRRVFPGNTFSIPAFYLKDRNGVTVAIAMNEILTPDGLTLSDSAEIYAREVASLIHYFSSYEGISVQASHSRSEEFISKIAHHIRVDKSKIKRTSSTEESQDHLVIRLE